MNVLKQFNYIFGRKQKWQTLGLFVMIVIGTVLELLGVSTIQPLVNSIVNPDQLMRNRFYKWVYDSLHMTSSTQLVLFLIIALIVLYIVKNAYLIFMYNRQYRYIYSNMRDLSTRMMHSYLARPYSYYLQKSSAELLRNISKDTADFFGVIRALVQLATECLVVVVLIVYLFFQDKSITLAVGTMLGIFMMFFYRLYKKNLLVMGEKNRFYEAQVNKWIQQAFGGIKEVKVMNKEDFFNRKYDEAYSGRVKSEYTYHTMITIPKPIIETVCMVSMLGATAVKLMMGINKLYFVSTLSVFVVAAYRMLPSFNRITEYLGTIAYQKPAVNAIYEELKEIDDYSRNENGAGAGSRRKEVKPLPMGDGIDIEHLTFRYPAGEKNVLEDVTFSIRKNTSVAFIGQSGAGKSTLADLILGALRPDAGAVLAGGVDVQNDLDAWHRTVGYIPQNIYLMDDTIAANIAFGIPESEVDHDRLMRAIDRAQLSEVVKALPDGVNTVVGERGIRFSGGQRQRIGIARALYSEPEVLILDEATSALDNETEKAVMESIDALHGEMTLIIIAHRLTTIENCDVIYSIGDCKAVLQEKAGK